MSEPDYILLLHKSFIGEISNEEKAVLDAWLADNPSNQAAADDLKQIWSGNWKEGPFKIDRKHVLSQRQRLIESISELKEQEISNSRLKIRYQLVASVVILLVTTMTTINFIANKRTQPFTIVAEGKKIVTLAAGGGKLLSTMELSLHWSDILIRSQSI